MKPVGRQFRVMIEYGMTPIEAIRSATTTAAEALGQAGEVGTITAGPWATSSRSTAIRWPMSPSSKSRLRWSKAER